VTTLKSGGCGSVPCPYFEKTDQGGKFAMRSIKLAILLTALLALALPVSHTLASADEANSESTLPTLAADRVVDTTFQPAAEDVEVHAAQYGGACYYGYSYYCSNYYPYNYSNYYYPYYNNGYYPYYSSYGYYPYNYYNYRAYQYVYYYGYGPYYYTSGSPSYYPYYYYYR
jgi:hypothetical protein